MKKFTILLVFLFILITTACGSSIPTTTRPANESNNTNQARPTPTSEGAIPVSTDLPLPYPGAVATAVTTSDNYPAPQEFPTIDPYPAESSTVWIVHPIGIQCEDAATSKYQSEQDVDAGLTAAGITVHEVTTTELIVCSACGCPTSIHYRAEINASDLNKAISLGWELG
jgi:hypothetical protein